MGSHALLSASSSKRWIECPPSARMCERYEDRGSDYAAEGTEAHTLCEYKLCCALGEDKALGKVLRPLQKRRKHQLEALGFRVYVIDHPDQIGGVLDEIRSS